MTVEVAEGKSEGPWKFPEAPEVVMRMEAGRRRTMRLESGRARRCYRGCVRSPSDGSLRHPAVLKGTGAFDPVVNVGNRGRGRENPRGWCAATSPDRAGT